MTSLEKSARIGALVDRIHAEMATGVLSCAGASVAFGAGEPLSMTTRSGDADLDDDQALAVVAAAFLRHAGELVMDGRAVVRRRPGHAVPWTSWRQRFIAALRSAESSPASPAAAPEDVLAEPDRRPSFGGDDGAVDRSDMPLPPPGETAIRGRQMDATVDLDTWAQLLGSGVITVTGPTINGVVVVAGRAVIDAFAIEAGGLGCCGPAARHALGQADSGTVSAAHLEEADASVLPALWRLPSVVLRIDRRALDLDGLLAAAAEGELDGVVEASSPDGDMVLFIHAGRPGPAYDADRFVDRDDFVSRWARGAGTASVRLQQCTGGEAIAQPRRHVAPAAWRAADEGQAGRGAVASERVPTGPDAREVPSWQDTERPDREPDPDGQAGGVGLGSDDPADEVAWERLAEHAAIAEDFPDAATDIAGDVSAPQPTAAEEPNGFVGPLDGPREEGADAPVRVVRAGNRLEDLRRDMTSIAGKLGGQAQRVLPAIEAAEGAVELDAIPDRLTTLVPHPAFRGLCERVASEMRSRLAET
jgi:hypothetical protein